MVSAREHADLLISHMGRHELERELQELRDRKPLNELRDAAHKNACAHGFHDEPISVGDSIALMHTELSEAFEAYREGMTIKYVKYEDKEANVLFDTPTHECADGTKILRKPVGVPSELADVVIRIFDFCGKHGIDLQRAVEEKMAYNATRPFKHGGKRL